ncbi:MAG: MFS transporter [Armatimonadetes bacterium]|nr:MFS transporter [Armatimonadota bacterium]
MPIEGSGERARSEPRISDADSLALSAARRRGLAILLFASFAADLAVSIVTLAVQFLGIALGAGPLLLGLYGTAASSVYGVMALVSGRAADKLGRRVGAAALFIGGAVWLLVGVQKSPYALVLLTPISAAVLAYFWPATQAWIRDLVADRRHLNAVLGSFNVLWTAGLMLGPVVCAYLWVRNHYAPFAASAGVAWLMALGLLMVPIGRKKEDRAAGEVSDDDTADPRADFYLPLAWAANFVSWSAAGVIRTLFPKLAHDLGFGEVVTGWLTFAYYVGQLGAFLALRQSSAWQYRRLPLVLGLTGGALGMGGAWLGRAPLTFGVCFAVAGVSVGFTYVASLFYSLQAPQHRRGRRAGIHEMTVGAGGALGPLVGGTVASYYGVRASFGALGLMYAAAGALLVLWSVLRQPPKRS